MTLLGLPKRHSWSDADTTTGSVRRSAEYRAGSRVADRCGSRSNTHLSGSAVITGWQSSGRVDDGSSPPMRSATIGFALASCSGAVHRGDAAAQGGSELRRGADSAEGRRAAGAGRSLCRCGVPAIWWRSLTTARKADGMEWSSCVAALHASNAGSRANCRYR